IPNRTRTWPWLTPCRSPGRRPTSRGRLGRPPSRNIRLPRRGGLMHRVNLHRVNRSAAWAVIAAAAVLAALTGCGAASAPGEPPTARMAHAGPHGALSVVLTPLGEQRVGVQ